MRIKLRVTEKQLRDGYHHIISIGYCDADALLAYEGPFGYTRGIYGWNADHYEIDGVLISTGYRPLKSRNSISDYEMVKRYNEQARAIPHSDTRREKVNALLRDFIKEATKQ